MNGASDALSELSRMHTSTNFLEEEKASLSQPILSKPCHAENVAFLTPSISLQPVQVAKPIQSEDHIGIINHFKEAYGADKLVHTLVTDLTDNPKLHPNYVLDQGLQYQAFGPPHISYDLSSWCL
ncbi:hypothetical protein BGZ76_006059, partial [Entomortierella beljakovae]